MKPEAGDCIDGFSGEQLPIKEAVDAFIAVWARLRLCGHSDCLIEEILAPIAAVLHVEFTKRVA